MHQCSKELTLPREVQPLPLALGDNLEALRMPSLRVFVYLRVLAMPESPC